VALRLGREGARLGALARGELNAPLVPKAEPASFEEQIELEWPIDNLEALSFVVRPLVDNLLGRLGCLHLACGPLRLELQLEGVGWDVRTVEVAAPTRDAATLLQLIRVHLEGHPPASAILGLRLGAIPEATRPMQLGLFEAAGPSPEKLAATLTRLTAMVGRDRVGAVALSDSHLPDAFSMLPFEGGKASPCEKKTVRLLALHAFRPMRRAEVVMERAPSGQIGLRFVQADGVRGQVLSCTGPFRVREHSFTIVLRDYYDVELSDGAIYRLMHDLGADLWHVDGCYE
jgi:protein ImuB